MNPVLLAAGIHLTVDIISIIKNELTEKEKEKKKKLEEQIESIINQSPEKMAESVMLDENKEYKTESILFQCLYNAADERMKEIEKRKQDIKDIIKEVKEALDSDWVISTPLRKNSLELLKRQLSESVEKCDGFIHYLKKYRSEIYRIRCKEKDIPIFSMIIPSNYPYVGKTMWISSEDLIEDTISADITSLFSIQILIEDYYDIDIPKDGRFPVMISRIPPYGKGFVASVEKGMFKVYELTNSYLGFEATVKNYDRKTVELIYRNKLRLSLPRSNLIKPYRFPAIRSTVHVFPVQWNNDLMPSIDKNRKEILPIVSERKRDVSSSLEFDSFPICFDKKGFNEFLAYFKENKLDSYDGEYLLGPVNGIYEGLRKGIQLKLQFGDIPLFIIEVDEYSEEPEYMRYYFKYHHMCKAEDTTFNADDIFVPFDVTFTPYYEGTSDNELQQFAKIEDFGDVTSIIWDVFEELRIQHQIKEDREGVLYFYKWESIIDQLISVLKILDSTIIKIYWSVNEVQYDRKGSYVIGEIQNYEELESFIHSVKSKAWDNRGPLFYVNGDENQHCDAEIIDGGSRVHIRGTVSSCKNLLNKSEIKLFAQNTPYAENQQKRALRQFRVGQVTNPKIQAACMNSSGIVPQYDALKNPHPLLNTALSKNESQRQAVENGLKERNIYFIQGPPGTGKTTVIRELVEQELEIYPSARILIVSQSNVAVDTVLEGLLERHKPQIVRCGNEEKISVKLFDVQLNRKCEEYMTELNEREGQFDAHFVERWKKTIIDDNNYFAPALNELIIRNHRIVGTTCVGLTKRNLGIERIEFDLVIMDEAGRALPAEMLIPLLRAKKAILIGDQQQLPPVINPIVYDKEMIELEDRTVSENELFCHSLFERLYNNAPQENKIMLDTQYRMPASIGNTISGLFYSRLLKNGEGTDEKKPVLFSANVTFINYDGIKQFCENNIDGAIINRLEADNILFLAKEIRKRNNTCKIAIITPYRGQKELIRTVFSNNGFLPQHDNIQINTIDAFQGSEADVVIFGMTRSQERTSFFNDEKRINVALSRACRELIILGKLEYLYKYHNSCLPSLADYIQCYGSIIESRDFFEK